jgi:ferredoxin
MEEYTLAGKLSIDHPDCTRCGSCIDACPRGVLKLGFTGFPEKAPDPVIPTSAARRDPAAKSEDFQSRG